MFLLIPLSFQTSAINHTILFLSFIVNHYVYTVFYSHLQFIPRYSNNKTRPTFLQYHIITISFIILFVYIELSRVDFVTQILVPGREATLSTTQSNSSPCYCHSATRKIALPFLRYPHTHTHTHTHTHNLSSVIYCRSHIAVFLVPSAKFHFCKSI